MNAITEYILIYLLLYKYITLFVISFLAAAIVPIPSGSILMAAAAFASMGYFDINIVFVVSLLGNILGDTVGYLLSRSYGTRVLHSVGFSRILSSSAFTTIESKFKRHTGFIIFISRFEVLSTLSVNILSGIERISYRKFIKYEILGSISQVFMYTYIGYTFGDQWQSADTFVGKSILIVVLIVVILFISFGKRKLKKVFGE
jgi:membrane-associated protein